MPFYQFSLCCRDRLVRFDSPVVMGILNVTPDSFYDGGQYMDSDHYLARVQQIVDEGADIVDIGVVSTRPGAMLLPPDVEAARLAEVVTNVRRHFPEVLISVDTCFSLPARVAVESGADIINDISGGFFDPEMFNAVASLQTPYILMHNLATPDHMQDNPHYDNLLGEVTFFFSEKVATLRRMGVKDIIIDPGFGFSKTIEHNYQLFGALDKLRSLFPSEPLLVAVSRKSMIYKLLDVSPDDALIGTTALHALALQAGAQLLRVHDVRAARQTIRVVSQMSAASDNNYPTH